MASSVDRVHLTTASFQLILHFYCELANLSKWICAYLFQLYCSRYHRFLLRKKVRQLLVFSLNSLTARTTKIVFLKIILFYKSVLHKQRQDKLAHDSACFRWPQLSFSFPDAIFRNISFHLSLLNFLVFSAYIQRAENCSITMSTPPHSRMHPNLRCVQGLHLLVSAAPPLVPQFNQTIPATRDDFGCFVWMPHCTNTDFVMCF